MHFQEGQDRNQMFITSLEEWVSGDSWARIVDLFVDVMPIKDFGFTNMELNKEDSRTIPEDQGPVYLFSVPQWTDERLR